MRKALQKMQHDRGFGVSMADLLRTAVETMLIEEGYLSEKETPAPRLSHATPKEWAENPSLLVEAIGKFEKAVADLKKENARFKKEITDKTAAAVEQILRPEQARQKILQRKH